LVGTVAWDGAAGCRTAKPRRTAWTLPGAPTAPALPDTLAEPARLIAAALLAAGPEPDPPVTVAATPATTAATMTAVATLSVTRDG
jgi:hypothetical protein